MITVPPMVRPQIAGVIAACVFTAIGCAEPPHPTPSPSVEIAAVSRAATEGDSPPQAAQDLAKRLAPELYASSWRWLASNGDAQLFAVQAPNNALCVVLIGMGDGDSATCSSWDDVVNNPLVFRAETETRDLVVGLFVDHVVAASIPAVSLTCRVRENVVFFTDPPDDASNVTITSSDGSRRTVEGLGSEGPSKANRSPGCG